MYASCLPSRMGVCSLRCTVPCRSAGTAPSMGLCCALPGQSWFLGWTRSCVAWALYWDQYHLLAQTVRRRGPFPLVGDSTMCMGLHGPAWALRGPRTVCRMGFARCRDRCATYAPFSVARSFFPVPYLSFATPAPLLEVHAMGFRRQSPPCASPSLINPKLQHPPPQKKSPQTANATMENRA